MLVIPDANIEDVLVSDSESTKNEKCDDETNADDDIMLDECSSSDQTFLMATFS